MVSAGDDIIASLQIQNIAVIKIDVEGAEMDVLNGLRGTLGKVRPFLICEILPLGKVDEDIRKLRIGRSATILALLREFDYTIFQIDETNGELAALDEFEVHDDYSRCQFCFCPAEWREKLKV
jgi:hypothetical protein